MLKSSWGARKTKWQTIFAPALRGLLHVDNLVPEVSFQG